MNKQYHKIQLTCLVCKEDSLPLEEEQEAVCTLCNQTFEANSYCENGHYVCHDCRQKDAREHIIQHCLASNATQPFELLLDLMKLPSTAMHGPEHHLLLTAALLTAYCNVTKREDLQELLQDANERSLLVPGGACGHFGICGAAIGAGIFSSQITEASPYTEEEWGACGQLTSTCGLAIAKQGGPRCCKRDSFISFLKAIRYANKELGTKFKIPKKIACPFFINNPDCKGKRCPFMHPVKKSG